MCRVLRLFGYAAGFLIVVLGRQQLFTENPLTAIWPLLIRRKIDVLASVAEAARIWVIVFLAYLIALGRFPHVIAGSVDTIYLVFRGSGSWQIIGGVSLVAVLNE